MKLLSFILFGILAASLIGRPSFAYAANVQSPPSPPQKIQVQQQDDVVLVKWKKPQTKNFSGFRIYRSQKQGKLGSLIKEVNKNTFSLKDATVQKNIIYFYTIRSFQKKGKESTNKKQYKIVIQGKAESSLPSCEPRQYLCLAQALANHPRVKNAIEMNPLTKGRDYQSFLFKHLNDLETNQTTDWSAYRAKTSFSEEEMLDIYLRKVAVSLHVEVYKIVPWSLLDYEDSYLNLLLSDLYVPDNFYLGRRQALFNGNPLEVLNYARETVSRYPNESSSTPKDFLHLIIRRMREDGWIHFGTEEKACDFAFFEAQDWHCLAAVKLGSSILTAEFLYAVLQVFNIPSYEEAQYTTGGHTGIIMPTLNIGMAGNYIYDSLRAGILLRPNKVPVSLSYDDLNQYQQWKKLPVCKSTRAAVRQAALNYLNLISSPIWKADIEASYQYTGDLFPQKGDFLKKVLLEDSIPSECQSTNPAGEKFWEPTLSAEEISQWFTPLSKF